MSAVTFQSIIWSLIHRHFGDEDIAAVVQRGTKLGKNCPKPPFSTVSLNGIPDFFTGRESILFLPFSGEVKQGDRLCMRTSTLFIDKLKLTVCPQFCKTVYTVNDFLPFARRALMILRPFFVAMRALKPCVRLRGVLCGWYVLFINIPQYLI